MSNLLSSVRSRWWALGAAWVVVGLLAVWGLSIAAGTIDSAPTRIVDRVYILPDFFARSVSADLGNANWQLSVARVLAPIVAGLTFFQGLASIFSERLSRLRARRHRDHVVVCGLGDKGQRLVADLSASGSSVVAIDHDPAVAASVAAAHEHATVLVGDATDRAQLLAAGTATARNVYAVCGDDGTNAEIADQVRRIATEGRTTPLRCDVHLSDDRLAGQLRIQSIREQIPELRLEYFSIYRRGAVVWVGKHLPLTSDHEDTGPHLLIVGLGQLGLSLVVHAGQAWADADRERQRPLRVTAIDRNASGRLGALRLEHPTIVDRLELEPIDLDLHEPDAHCIERFQAILESECPDAAFVAFDEDARSISTALQVRNALGRPESTVVARTRGATGLGVLVDVNGLGDGLGIETFPLIDQTCRVAVLELGVHEQVARALHDSFVHEVTQGIRPASPYAVPWDELPETARESNRREADGIATALTAIGCELIPVRRWVEDRGCLTDADVEHLAAYEHERWREERTADGWTYGPERDDDAKRNPLLVAWADLPEPARASGRQSAEDLPLTLARAGFEIVRASQPISRQ